MLRGAVRLSAETRYESPSRESHHVKSNALENHITRRNRLSRNK